jgi:sulfatase maturation enzyme AslB (radical SAM superfamily)
MNKRGCYWANHGMVFFNDLSFRPCCRFPKIDPSVAPKQEEGVSGAFQNHFFQQVRDRLNSGEFPAGCEVCQKEEIGDLRSLRQLMENEEGVDGQMESLEIFVGSTCNMKCRMCDARASSMWAQDLGLKSHPKIDMESLLEKADLSGLKRLRLLGGETLLNKNFFQLRQILSERVDTQKVELSFATNGSVAPNQEIISILELFGSVRIDFSIDGIGPVGEYIRHGVSWSVVNQAVMSWFGVKSKIKTNIDYNIHTTLQGLNYLYIPDILYFCFANETSWSQRTLDFPPALQLSNIPIPAREHIVDSYQSHPRHDEIIGFLQKKNRTDIWKYLTESLLGVPYGDINMFIAELDKYDKRWNTSWKQSLPELDKIISHHN